MVLEEIDLAEKVVKAVEGMIKNFNYYTKMKLQSLKKIETVCREIYGADGVNFSDEV